MDTSLTFAVCYTEVFGNSSATWTDSGIRLTVSKISTMHYGPSSTSFPVRSMDSANLAAAVHRLPQIAGAIVTYVGDLGTAKWLSLVDSALNSNNPCVQGTVAAASAGSEPAWWYV